MKRRQPSTQLTAEPTIPSSGWSQPPNGNPRPLEVDRENEVLPGSTSGLELEYPARIVPYPAWVGHIPFAFWIVETLKPHMVVELGVHTGNSYCAFLQAVHALGLEARCFGVDHWQGDEHAGFYGDEVYRELRAYHDPLYGAFSTLLRSTFDDALPYFNEQSVDLLHIDGFHTYEAVSRDFTSWFPKMSSRGIVMFHDINVRERGFGIWRVWDEVATRFPTFDFVHSHGLGVAYVGSEPPPIALASLFAPKSEAQVGRVRAYFARLGTSIQERFGLCEAEKSARRLEDELSASSATISEQAQATTGLEAKVEAAEAKMTRQARHAERTAAALREAEERERRFQDELGAAHAKITEQAQALRTTQVEFEAERTAYEMKLQALQSKVAEAITERAQLQAEIAAAHATITEQAQANVASEATIQAAQARITESAAEHESSTRMLRQQMANTMQLRRELIIAHQQARELNREINLIRHSRSWRFTAPLRMVRSKWFSLQGVVGSRRAERALLRRTAAPSTP